MAKKAEDMVEFVFKIDKEDLHIYGTLDECIRGFSKARECMDFLPSAMKYWNGRFSPADKEANFNAFVAFVCKAIKASAFLSLTDIIMSNSGWGSIETYCAIKYILDKKLYYSVGFRNAREYLKASRIDYAELDGVRGLCEYISSNGGQRRLVPIDCNAHLDVAANLVVKGGISADAIFKGCFAIRQSVANKARRDFEAVKDELEESDGEPELLPDDEWYPWEAEVEAEEYNGVENDNDGFCNPEPDDMEEPTQEPDEAEYAGVENDNDFPAGGSGRVRMAPNLSEGQKRFISRIKYLVVGCEADISRAPQFYSMMLREFLHIGINVTTDRLTRMSEINEFIDAGVPRREVAELFGVSMAVVNNDRRDMVRHIRVGDEVYKMKQEA